MALLSLALPVAGKRCRQGLLIVGLAGASLFFGDAMITPAISVLSAVEGLRIVSPGVTPYVVPIAAVVLVCLFSIQSRGSGAVGFLFGPIMAVWFVTLAVVGLIHLVQCPRELLSLSPTYALALMPGMSAPESHVCGLRLGVPRFDREGRRCMRTWVTSGKILPIRISWFARSSRPLSFLVYLGHKAPLLCWPIRQQRKIPFSSCFQPGC